MSSEGKVARELKGIKVYEYWAPFQEYPNIELILEKETGNPPSIWGEKGKWSCELSPFSGSITITEEEPIIGVTVFGSACTPPGYVCLEAYPLNPEPLRGLPIRMRVDNLWGTHIRWDLAKAGVHVSSEIKEGQEGSRATLPMAGYSSAHFDLPVCKKVVIMGGCQIPPASDRHPYDAHYLFHLVRITVTETRNTLPSR